MKQVVYEVQLGLKEVSPPCYKESPTDPWEDPCVSVALQVMIRNDHLMDGPANTKGASQMASRRGELWL